MFLKLEKKNNLFLVTEFITLVNLLTYVSQIYFITVFVF